MSIGTLVRPANAPLTPDIFAISTTTSSDADVIALSGEYLRLKTPQALKAFIKLPLAQGSGDGHDDDNPHQLWNETHFKRLDGEPRISTIPNALPTVCWQNVEVSSTAWQQYAAEFCAYGLKNSYFPLDCKGEFTSICHKQSVVDHCVHLSVYAPEEFRKRLQDDLVVHAEYNNLYAAQKQFGFTQDVNSLCDVVVSLLKRIVQIVNVAIPDVRQEPKTRLVPDAAETTYKVVTSGVHALTSLQWQEDDVVFANTYTLTDHMNYTSVAINYGDFGNAVRGAAACVSLLYFVTLSDKPRPSEDVTRSLETMADSSSLQEILQSQYVGVTPHPRAQQMARLFLRGVYTSALSCNAFSSWRTDKLYELYNSARASIDEIQQSLTYDVYEQYLETRVWPQLCMFLWVACTARKQPVQTWVSAFVRSILYPPVSLYPHLSFGNQKLEMARNSTLQTLRVNLDLIKTITLTLHSATKHSDEELVRLNKSLRDARIRAVVCSCACAFVYFKYSDSRLEHERNVHRDVHHTSIGSVAILETVDVLREFVRDMEETLRKDQSAASDVYRAAHQHIDELWNHSSDIFTTATYTFKNADMYMLRAICAAILGHGQDDGTVDLFETFSVITPDDASLLLRQVQMFARSTQNEMFKRGGVSMPSSVEHTVGSSTNSVQNTRPTVPSAAAPDASDAPDGGDVGLGVIESDSDSERDSGATDDGADAQPAEAEPESRLAPFAELPTRPAVRQAKLSETQRMLGLIPVIDIAHACVRKYGDSYHTEATADGASSVAKRLYNTQMTNLQEVTSWTDLLTSTSTSQNFNTSQTREIDTMWRNLPNQAVLPADTGIDNNIGQSTLMMYPSTDEEYSVYGLARVVNANLYTLEYVSVRNTYTRRWISYPGSNTDDVAITFDSSASAIGTRAFERIYRSNVQRYTNPTVDLTDDTEAEGTQMSMAHPLSRNGRALNTIFKAAGYVDTVVSRFCENCVPCNPCVIAPPLVKGHNSNVLKQQQGAQAEAAKPYDAEQIQTRTDKRTDINPAGLRAQDRDILVPGIGSRSEPVLRHGFTCLSWDDNLQDNEPQTDLDALVNDFEFDMGVAKVGSSLTYVSKDFERIEKGYNAVYCVDFMSFLREIRRSHEEPPVEFDASELRILRKRHAQATQSTLSAVWGNDKASDNLFDLMTILICRSAMGCVTRRRDVQWSESYQKWVSMPLNDVVQRKECLQSFECDGNSKLTLDGQRFVAFVNGYVDADHRQQQVVLSSKNGLAYFVCYVLQYDDKFRTRLIEWCSNIVDEDVDARRGRWILGRSETQEDQLHAVDFFKGLVHFTRVFYWQIKLCMVILEECSLKPLIEVTPGKIINVQTVAKQTQVAPTALQSAESADPTEAIGALTQQEDPKHLTPNLFVCKLQDRYDILNQFVGLRPSSARYHDYFLCVRYMNNAIHDTAQQMFDRSEVRAMRHNFYPDVTVTTQSCLAQKDNFLHLSAEVTGFRAQLDKQPPRMDVQFALVINGMHGGVPVRNKCVCPTQPVLVELNEDEQQIMTTFSNSKVIDMNDSIALSGMSTYTVVTADKFVTTVQEVCAAHAGRDTRPIVFDASAVLFFERLCTAAHLSKLQEIRPLVQFAYVALPLRMCVGNATGADKLRKVTAAGNGFRELFVAVAEDLYVDTQGYPKQDLTMSAFQQMSAIESCGHNVFYNTLPYCPVNRVKLPLQSGGDDTWLWPFVYGFHTTLSDDATRRSDEFLKIVDVAADQQLALTATPVHMFGDMVFVYTSACPNLFLSGIPCLLLDLLNSFGHFSVRICDAVVKWVVLRVLHHKDVPFSLPTRVSFPQVEDQVFDELRTRLKDCLSTLCASVSPYNVRNRDALDAGLRAMRENITPHVYKFVTQSTSSVHYYVSHLPEGALTSNIVSRHPSQRVFGLVSVPVEGHSHCRDYFVAYRSDTELQELTATLDARIHLSKLHADNRLLTDEEFAAEVLATASFQQDKPARVCCTMAAAARFCALFTSQNTKPPQESDLHIDGTHHKDASLYVDFGQDEPLSARQAVAYCGMSWSALAGRAKAMISTRLVPDRDNICWLVDKVKVTYVCGVDKCEYECRNSSEWVERIQHNIMNGTCPVHILVTLTQFDNIPVSLPRAKFLSKDSALHDWENTFSTTLTVEALKSVPDFPGVHTPLTIAFLAFAQGVSKASEVKTQALKQGGFVLDVITTTQDTVRYCGGWDVSGTACRATSDKQRNKCAETPQSQRAVLATVIKTLLAKQKEQPATVRPEPESDEPAGHLEPVEPDDEGVGLSDEDMAQHDEHDAAQESDDEREPEDMCASTQEQASSESRLLESELDMADASLPSYHSSMSTVAQDRESFNGISQILRELVGPDADDALDIEADAAWLANTSDVSKDIDEFSPIDDPELSLLQLTEDALTEVDAMNIQELSTNGLQDNFVFVSVLTKEETHQRVHKGVSGEDADIANLPFVLQTRPLQPHAREATNASTVATGLNGERDHAQSFTRLFDHVTNQPNYTLTPQRLTREGAEIYVAMDQHAVAKLCAKKQEQRVHDWIRAGIVRKYNTDATTGDLGDGASAANESPDTQESEDKGKPQSSPEPEQPPQDSPDATSSRDSDTESLSDDDDDAAEAEPAAGRAADTDGLVSLDKLLQTARSQWIDSQRAASQTHGETTIWNNIPHLRVPSSGEQQVLVVVTHDERCVQLTFGTSADPVMPCIYVEGKNVSLVPLLRAAIDVPLQITDENYSNSICFVTGDVDRMLGRVCLWVAQMGDAEFEKGLAWKFDIGTRETTDVTTQIQMLNSQELELCFVGRTYYDRTVGVYNAGPEDSDDSEHYVFALSEDTAATYELFQNPTLAGTPDLPTADFLKRQWIPEFEQTMELLSKPFSGIDVIELDATKPLLGPFLLRKIRENRYCVLLQPNVHDSPYVDFVVLMPVRQTDLYVFATSQAIMAVVKPLQRQRTLSRQYVGEKYVAERRQRNVYGVVESPGVMCQVLTKFVQEVTDFSAQQSAYIVWKCCTLVTL